MLTTRMSPKIRAKPLATMKSAAANAIESRKIFRNDDGSWTAEPNVVVVERAMVVDGRRRVPFEQVHLLVSDLQPEHRPVGECRRRHTLHPEELLVEARGLLEVVGLDGDVVDPSRLQAAPIL